MLEKIGIGEELLDDAEADGSGEDLRIGDGDRQLEMAVIAAAEAFLDAHLLAVTGAARVQPATIVESRRVEDQRVAFPSADRVPLPRRRRIDRELSSIG